MGYVGVFLLSFMVSFSAMAKKDSLTVFEVDAVHSFVLFKVSHLGFSNTYGRFKTVSGQIELDKKKVENSKLTMEIQVSSLNTEDAKRDKHLRGPDFFNVKQFPKITFKSTKITPSGSQYKITGMLNMRGQSKEITGDLELMRTGKDPWGAIRTGGEARFLIDRKDFNMKYMSGENGIGEKVEIIASIEGIQKGSKK